MLMNGFHQHWPGVDFSHHDHARLNSADELAHHRAPLEWRISHLQSARADGLLEQHLGRRASRRGERGQHDRVASIQQALHQWRSTAQFTQ